MEMYGYEFTREEDLEHHGILGQKWGKRNGPPYPLDAGDHSAAEKKAGWRKSLDDKDQKVKKNAKTSGPIALDSKDPFSDLIKKNPNAAVQPRNLGAWAKSHKKEIAIGIALAAAGLGAVYVAKNSDLFKNVKIDEIPEFPQDDENEAWRKQIDQAAKQFTEDSQKIQDYRDHSVSCGYVGPEEYGGFASPEEQKIYGWLYANYVDKTHAITESEFQAMENVGVNLDAGHAMFRLAKGKHSTLRDGIEYVSISEEDRKRYQGFLPQMWKSRGAKITEVFEIELAANTKIKAPGKKETIEIMESAMRKMYGNQYSNDFIHKDVLNHFYAYQGNLATRSWDFSKVFFSELTARGYNATIDFNDAGNLAEKPLILLNGAKSATVKGVRSYSVSECKQVFAEVKSPGNYADFSAQKWLADIPRIQRVSDEFGIKNWLK